MQRISNSQLHKIRGDRKDELIEDSVPCPRCSSFAGEGCVSPGTERLIPRPHNERRAAFNVWAKEEV